MPVIARKTTVGLQGVCTIEDAEPLLKWLLVHPGGKVQIKDCVNMHAAVLQTLIAGKAKCIGTPSDAGLGAWIGVAVNIADVSISDGE